MVFHYCPRGALNTQVTTQNVNLTLWVGECVLKGVVWRYAVTTCILFPDIEERRLVLSEVGGWFKKITSIWRFASSLGYGRLPLHSGPPGGVLDSDFPWQNRSYPEIPWNIFNFPDPEFSSLSSRRVFCFRLRALSNTVKIDMLPRKIVPGYNRAYQGVLDIKFLGRIVFVFYQISLECFVPTLRDHLILFPFTVYKNSEILCKVGVSHPISRNLKTYFSDIPSKKVANPASR